MDKKTEGVDIAYKLLFLVESNVGKTSIILRYIDNTFDDSTIATRVIRFEMQILFL